MAEEPLTISSSPPERVTQNYDDLRQLGIDHLQELAGKVWTDYNSSDPGVTSLEAMSYAITDLSYRTSFQIKDLLAKNPNDQSIIDIKNFYTARKIMPNAPVSFNDYRKLMMDVEVYDPFNPECEFAGVKNAWIEKAPSNEVPIYLHRKDSKLEYEPDPDGTPEDLAPLPIKILYDVLLEFDDCDAFGDLNTNTLTGDLTIFSHPDDPAVDGMLIRPSISFPRWDETEVDWDDAASIKEFILSISIGFFNVPDGYEFGFNVDGSNNVTIIGTRAIPGSNNRENVPGLAELTTQVNTFLYDATNDDSMVRQYQAKVYKVLEILDEVKATLSANRNLCEDFFRFSALKVEEIALCADIALESDASVDLVEAQIYHEVSKHLNPTVFFYTLDEMLAKGYTTDEIFEGPRLDHGFIDDAELLEADRVNQIHVSDLIQIIMDIPGVISVNSIQIANLPQDNETGIASKSVRWCLNLAVEQNYVPRLTTNRSKLTFFKEQLPFGADPLEVEKLMDELDDQDRPQKLQNPTLDIPVPQGIYRDVQGYESIQDDFPLNYGIGAAGLPSSASQARKGQAKQLKGFLMFFDQLLADYLSQLGNFKFLFSMNGEKDGNGNYLVDKTYFSQPLFNSVPNINELLVDQVGHAERLQKIAESEGTFLERRNQFLDHLLARFAESFSDYALLTYRIDGPAGAEELIEDKLRFLDSYPVISSGRGKGYNYSSPCEAYSVNNVAGVNARGSLLVGIDDRPASTLDFSPHFQIIDTAILPNPFTFQILEAVMPVLKAPSGQMWATEDDVKLHLELVVLNGASLDHYVIEEESGSAYTFRLICGAKELAESVDTYTSLGDAETAVEQTKLLLSKEFFGNPLSNRNNLSCPLEAYYDKSISAPDMLANPPTYTLDINLYANAFQFTGTPLLTSHFDCEGPAKGNVPIAGVDLVNNYFLVEAYLLDFMNPGDVFLVENSAGNDQSGGYTVDVITFAGNTSFIRPVETIPSDTAPFGDLLYNVQSEAEVLADGELKARELMWTISNAGVDVNQYRFEPSTSPFVSYHFEIATGGGSVLATGTETDFNDAVATELANTQGNKFTVTGSSFNNGDYTLDLAEGTMAEGPNVMVFVNETIPNTVEYNGALTYTNRYSYTTDQATRTFTVPGEDLTPILRVGDQISIEFSPSNDGTYDIEEISFSGGDTIMRVGSTIPSDADDGDLIFTRSFPIVGFELPSGGGNGFIVKGGADDIAVQDMIAFLQSKFFEHEGMHVLEHILLRPRFKDKVFVPATADTLTTDRQGDVILKPTLAISGVTQDTHEFRVNGDWVSVFSSLSTIEVIDSAENDGTYTIQDVYLSLTKTVIKVEGNIPTDCITDGLIRFTKTAPIAFAEGKEVFLNAFNDVIPFLNYLHGEGALGNGSQNPFTFTTDLTFVDEFTESSAYRGNNACDCRPKADTSWSLNTTSWDLDIHITDGCGYDCLITATPTAADEALADYTKLLRFAGVSSDSSGPILEAWFLDEATQSEVLVKLEATIPCFTLVTNAEDDCDKLIKPGDEFEIINSFQGFNDGLYVVEAVRNTGTTVITISGKYDFVRPNLLPISLDDECAACQLTDPYSCMVTVIAPYWQGRFVNADFRKFFDRTMRLEMPAHVSPQFCIISCEQMEEFEFLFKKWILEQAKSKPDPVALTKALDELIDILSTLRNVYPSGTLHDCEEDDTLANAIILNNTIIGNA